MKHLGVIIETGVSFPKFLIGNPVFKKGSGCPITDFGHDDLYGLKVEIGSN